MIIILDSHTEISGSNPTAGPYDFLFSQELLPSPIRKWSSYCNRNTVRKPTVHTKQSSLGANYLILSCLNLKKKYLKYAMTDSLTYSAQSENHFRFMVIQHLFGNRHISYFGNLFLFTTATAQFHAKEVELVKEGPSQLTPEIVSSGTSKIRTKLPREIFLIYFLRSNCRI